MQRFGSLNDFISSFFTRLITILATFNSINAKIRLALLSVRRNRQIMVSLRH